MKIAYNPKTATALTTAPANNDITFDLSGLNIFARGVKFKGTDTTYSVFKKHTSASGGGYNGLVPVPSYTTTNIRFLREDGTWKSIDSYLYTQITNQDLNTLKTEGKWYYAAGDNTTTNKPSGVTAYELYVGRNANGYRYLKLITSDGIIWFRYHNASNWTSWVRWYTDANTDYRVKQSTSTTSNFRPLILGYNNSTDKSVLANDITNLVYTTTTIYAQPNSGTLYANKFIGKIDWSNINGKPSCFTPCAHTHSSNLITTLTSYAKATSDSALSTSDSLNIALGKLEYKGDLGVTAYNLVNAAYDGDGTIENLKEILKVLEGIKDTETIKGLLGKYLPLAGGTMTGSINISTNSVILWNRNTDYAKIHFKNTGDGDTDSYLGFETGDNGNEYFKFSGKSGSTVTLWMSIKAIGVTSGGFIKSGSSDSYVLLGGGGHKPISDFATVEHNHNSSYVSAVSISGNYLRVTKNGTNTDLTIPYATTASLLNNKSISDPNTAASGLNVKWYSQINQSSGYAGTNYGFPVSNNANGILWLGTHSGPYGWLMGFSSNGRIYARHISNNSFSTAANGSSWARIAWTSDIPAVTNYYWANVQVSSSSSTTTTPTFATATATTSVTTPLVTSSGVLTLNGVSGVYLKYNNTDGASIVLSSTYFKPFDTANNKLSLGTSSARWSNVYSVLGNFSGAITIGGKTTTVGLENNSHYSWKGGNNFYCIPTGNSQEWSFDVGAKAYGNGTNSTYTGTYLLIWSCKNSNAIAQFFNDTRHVNIPIHLYVGGYNNTSYALSTASFICQSWVRTTGSTGWYNETYAGGWYMTDSDYVRSYNNKRVYNANTSLYAFYADGGMTAAGFYKSGSSDSYILLGGGGHKLISDFMLKTDELSNNLTIISKSLTITQAWMDTGIKYTDLPANGTYIVQVSANNTADYIWSNYWSGIMSWYIGGTNDSEADEIILHRAGHAYHHTIYLRTIMTASSDGRHLRLQIAADTNLSTAVTYTFKFKRVI